MPYFPDAPPLLAGYAPPPGWYIVPAGMGVPTSSKNLVSGRVYFSGSPVRACRVDSLRVNVGTAQVGGDNTNATIALYYDDGTGEMPDFARGPIVQGVVSLAAPGNVDVALASPLALPTGIYWTVFLWVSSAPGTFPRMLANSSGITTGYAAPASNWSAATVGYRSDGFTQLPTAPIDLASINLLNNLGDMPLIGLRGV